MTLVKKSLLIISALSCFAYAGEKIAIVTKIIGKAKLTVKLILKINLILI